MRRKFNFVRLKTYLAESCDSVEHLHFVCDLYFDGYATYVDNKNAIIVNQIGAYGLFCSVEDWYGSSSNEGNLNTAICIEKEINSNIAAIAGNINPLSE